MLSRDERPRTLDEVAGQPKAKAIFKAILANPEKAPKVLLQCGPFGVSKTTMARIFGAEINKISYDEIATGNHFLYQEYDSTSIGNVDTIRALRDEWMVCPKLYQGRPCYKVIVLDESHVISRVAQTALLKVFEDAPNNIFFLIPTTDPDKLLPTIVSRSLVVPYELIPKEDVLSNLKRVCEKHNFDYNPEILDLIYKKSGGHMRNAHMLLDNYFLMGDDVKVLLDTPVPLFNLYFQTFDYSILDRLLKFPIQELKTAYSEWVATIARLHFKEGKTHPVLKANPIIVLKNLTSTYVLESFQNDYTFTAIFLSLKQVFGGGSNAR